MTPVGDRRVWWLVPLALVVGCADARAETSPPLTNDEVALFLNDVSRDITACRIDDLARKFLNSASVTFIWSDGRKQFYTKAAYIEHLRQRCVPERIKWDRRSLQVTVNGTSATLTHDGWWHLPDKNGGQPMLIFHDRLELARSGFGMGIAKLVSRSEELVPGADKAYDTRNDLLADWDEIAWNFCHGLLKRVLTLQGGRHPERVPQ